MKKRLVALLTVLILAAAAAGTLVTASACPVGGGPPQSLHLSGAITDNPSVMAAEHEVSLDISAATSSYYYQNTLRQSFRFVNKTDSAQSAKGMILFNTLMNRYPESPSIKLTDGRQSLPFELVPVTSRFSFESTTYIGQLFEKSVSFPTPLGAAEGWKEYVFPTDCKEIRFNSTSGVFAYGHQGFTSIKDYYNPGSLMKFTRYGVFKVLANGELSNVTDENGRALQPVVTEIENIYDTIYENARIYSFLDEHFNRYRFREYLDNFSYYKRSNNVYEPFTIYEDSEIYCAIVFDLGLAAFDEQKVELRLTQPSHLETLNVSYLIPARSNYTASADFRLAVAKPDDLSFGSMSDGFVKVSGSKYEYTTLKSKEQLLSFSVRHEDNFFIAPTIDNFFSGFFTLLLYGIPALLLIAAIVMLFVKPKSNRYLTKTVLVITALLTAGGSFFGAGLSLLIGLTTAWAAGLVVMFGLLFVCYIPALVALVAGISVTHNKYRKLRIQQLIADAQSRSDRYDNER